MPPDIEARFREALGLASLTLVLRPEHAVSSIEGRRNLREALREHLLQRYFGTVPDLDSLMDLSAPPTCEGISLSISHGPELGGFATVPRPATVGLDTESRSRVTAKLLNRIASSEEIELSPEPAFIWCAKEAAFKSLLLIDPPKVLTDLAIEGWEAGPSGLSLFRVKRLDNLEEIPGQGACWAGASTCIALFAQFLST